MSMWHVQRVILKDYEDKIAYLEDGLVFQRKMAVDFVDSGNISAFSSTYLMIQRDETEVEILRAKHELTSDDFCFQKEYSQFVKNSDEDRL